MILDPHPTFLTPRLFQHTQLYARSGQLATAKVLYKRGMRENDLCCLGCDVMGDMHHIFVHCKQYKQWREDVRMELNMQTEEAMKTGLLKAAKFLFTNNVIIWPLHHSLYYLGQIPNLNPLISREAGMGEIER